MLDPPYKIRAVGARKNARVSIAYERSCWPPAQQFNDEERGAQQHGHLRHDHFAGRQETVQQEVKRKWQVD